MIHGLMLEGETRFFNGAYYDPARGNYWRIEPDKLDFSAVDASLVEEGQQRFDFIGNREFTGVAGELRVERLSADDSLFSIQGDRTGDGVADLTVEYKIYYTNPFIEPDLVWSAWITENALIL